MAPEQNLYSSNADRRFHLEQILDWSGLSSVRPEVDVSTYALLLESVGKVAGGEIAARAKQKGHSAYKVEGVRLVWPQGITDSYQAIKNLGLNAATVSSGYGGLELPFTINLMMLEMLFQADAGFTTIPGLQTGVADVLQNFASEELKRNYLPRMVSGEYTAAMDLTESRAGSDLGGIRTLARNTGLEGVARITGEKIFITNGGAELHVVLAREADTFEDTKGTTKGLSMYLVPREMEGKENGVRVERVEEKLGLHSSPTCAVSFNEAQGYLVGEKGMGFKYMLLLMNKARLSVAGQALGILEGAYLEAFSYTQEREQFGRKIAEHSPVKKILAEIKLSAEVIRSVLYPAAFAVDMEEGLTRKLLEATDAQVRASLELERQQYAQRAAVLTFASKFYAAEKAVELSRKALQVHGGMGYMQESRIGGLVLDSFITTIYEGTSEIQAGQLLSGALKAQIFGSSRSDIRVLLDDVENGLQKMAEEPNGTDGKIPDCSMLDLVGMVITGSTLLRRSLTSLGGQMMQGIEVGMEQKKAENLAALAGKDLAAMTFEVYAGYQLLLQAQKDERKKVVAEVFITEEMVPNLSRRSLKIHRLNEKDLEKYETILEG